MVIDRNKYMDMKEARQLRTVTEARSITDLRAGRIGGVRAWMLVDLALSTGLRVSEMAALQRIWKRSVKLAGLPKELSIHSARHTIAVHLLKKTGNLRQVQKQLGHASPAITANMYADISFEDMQNGVTGLYQ